MKISQKRQARQRGNALVEFAICSVCLLLITIGVTDFARLFTIADMAASAAAAGTQYGSLSPAHYTDYNGMQEAALQDTGNLTGATAAASQTCYCTVGGQAVTCPADCTAGSPETYVTVQTFVPFTPTFSYPWVPTVLSVSGASSVRVQ
jgi:Flp pilus assembly protein TadG